VLYQAHHYAAINARVVRTQLTSMQDDFGAFGVVGWAAASLDAYNAVTAYRLMIPNSNGPTPHYEARPRRTSQDFSDNASGWRGSKVSGAVSLRRAQTGPPISLQFDDLY